MISEDRGMLVVVESSILESMRGESSPTTKLLCTSVVLSSGMVARRCMVERRDTTTVWCLIWTLFVYLSKPEHKNSERTGMYGEEDFERLDDSGIF